MCDGGSTAGERAGSAGSQEGLCAQARDAAGASGQPMVLLVEPAVVLRTVAKTVCRRRGAEVITANEVGDALTVITQRRPAAVLLAVELPGLPGTALVAALRSSPEHRAIPIAILTTADSAKAATGVYQPDQVIVKDEHFEEQVDQFLESLLIGTAPEGDLKPTTTGGLQLSGRILLAEDSASLQLLFGRMLHVAGAEVTIASDGKQALKLASQAPFDLILMDIEMPELDGREATKALRAQGINTPIVALTAHDVTELEADIRQIGFDGVINKPVQRETLIEACKAALKHARAAGTEETKPPQTDHNR